jgi:hypothetical protein
MATAAKPNQQPCTESCVVSGNAFVPAYALPVYASQWAADTSM